MQTTLPVNITLSTYIDSILSNNFYHKVSLRKDD